MVDALLARLSAPVLKGHGATSSSAVCAGTLSAANAVRASLIEKISSSNSAVVSV